MVVDEDPFPLYNTTIERQNDFIIQRTQTAALIEARAYDGELHHGRPFPWPGNRVPVAVPGDSRGLRRNDIAAEHSGCVLYYRSVISAITRMNGYIGRQARLM